MSNGLFCLHCGKPLVGKQTKYCTDVHRQAYNRSKKTSGQASAETDKLSASQTALIEVDKLKTDLVKAESIGAVVMEERDRLLVTVERSNAQMTEAKESAAASGAKVELLNSTIKTWQIIAGALLAGILAMAFILIQSI